MTRPKRKPLPSTAITPERLAESGSEDGHQMALFCWANNGQTREMYPELEWLFAIPNGGQRHKAVALKLKAMGVKRGVSDMCLAVRRGSWPMLWIELKLPKREDGRKATGLKPEQTKWGDRFKELGCGFICVRGWEEARQVIIRYLEWDGKTE
jgi:hypothetical protein